MTSPLVPLASNDLFDAVDKRCRFRRFGFFVGPEVTYKMQIASSREMAGTIVISAALDVSTVTSRLVAAKPGSLSDRTSYLPGGKSIWNLPYSLETTLKERVESWTGICTVEIAAPLVSSTVPLRRAVADVCCPRTREQESARVITVDTIRFMVPGQ